LGGERRSQQKEKRHKQEVNGLASMTPFPLTPALSRRERAGVRGKSMGGV